MPPSATASSGDPQSRSGRSPSGPERRTPSRDFAARCDEVFDTPGTFTRLEERLHDLPYPASFRPFAGYEAEARALRMFEHVLVPGLLQTPEYAPRARFRAGPPRAARLGG